MEETSITANDATKPFLLLLFKKGISPTKPTFQYILWRVAVSNLLNFKYKSYALNIPPSYEFKINRIPSASNCKRKWYKHERICKACGCLFIKESILLNAMLFV